MSADELLNALHTVVNSYLSTLETTAIAVAEACPPVGRPYGQRMSRLRARLAFDSAPDKIEQSCAVAARELMAYAEKASGYVDHQRGELRGAIAALEEIARTLAQRQDFYGNRLRRLAAQMEKEDPEQPTGSSVAALLSCVESMSHESESLLKRMRDEMAQVETRLAAAEITDRATGLLNRQEIQRVMAAMKPGTEKPVLLRFDCRESLSDEVARQVAARLGSQFRYYDLIARWSNRQFLVLFRGSEKTARQRAEQILPWIAGQYQAEGGAVVTVAVEVRLLDETCLAGPERSAS